jgi:hypothetical protein
MHEISSLKFEISDRTCSTTAGEIAFTGGFSSQIVLTAVTVL